MFAVGRRGHVLVPGGGDAPAPGEIAPGSWNIIVGVQDVHGKKGCWFPPFSFSSLFCPPPPPPPRKRAEHTECCPAREPVPSMPRLDADFFLQGFDRSILLDVLLSRSLPSGQLWCLFRNEKGNPEDQHHPKFAFSSGSRFEKRISCRPIRSQPPPLATPGTRMNEGRGVISCTRMADGGRRPLECPPVMPARWTYLNIILVEREQVYAPMRDWRSSNNSQIHIEESDC